MSTEKHPVSQLEEYRSKKRCIEKPEYSVEEVEGGFKVTVTIRRKVSDEETEEMKFEGEVNERENDAKRSVALKVMEHLRIA